MDMGIDGSCLSLFTWAQEKIRIRIDTLLTDGSFRALKH